MLREYCMLSTQIRNVQCCIIYCNYSIWDLTWPFYCKENCFQKTSIQNCITVWGDWLTVRTCNDHTNTALNFAEWILLIMKKTSSRLTIWPEDIQVLDISDPPAPTFQRSCIVLKQTQTPSIFWPVFGKPCTVCGTQVLGLYPQGPRDNVFMWFIVLLRMPQISSTSLPTYLLVSFLTSCVVVSAWERGTVCRKIEFQNCSWYTCVFTF